MYIHIAISVVEKFKDNDNSDDEINDESDDEIDDESSDEEKDDNQ